jgi:hypothetical protein
MSKKYSSSKIKSLFYGRAKVIAIISIMLIISISYGLFFYFQDITERNVKSNLFAQQRDRQIITTRDANSIHLQQGDLTNNKTKECYNFLNIDRIVDHLFVVNKNNIITIDIAARGATTFVGTNVSHREYVTQAQKTLEPVFSNGYLGLDGKTRIGIMAVHDMFFMNAYQTSVR